MPIAAHTTGGHSTPHLLLGLAILLLALAGAGTLLPSPPDSRRTEPARLSARHRRARVGNAIVPNRRSNRARARRPDADPAVEHDTNLHGASGDRGVGSAGRLNPRHVGAQAPGQARRSPETLEPLADSLRSHLLAIAEAHVAETLARAPVRPVVVGRYVLMDGHRIPFLILGETGVFAVWALTGPPVWDELPFPGEMADRVKAEAARIHGPGAGRPVPRTRHPGDRAALVVPPRRTRRMGDGTRMADPLDRALRSRPRPGRKGSPTVARALTPKPGPVARAPDVVPDLR